MRRTLLIVAGIVVGVLLTGVGLWVDPAHTADPTPAAAAQTDPAAHPKSTAPAAAPSGTPPAPSEPPATSRTTVPTPGPAPLADRAVHGALGAVVGGRVGLAVYDLRTDTLLADSGAQRVFPTESVVKLLIALDALDRGDSADLVAEMLSRSDDRTATRLWDLGGGPRIVSRMARRLGLAHTTPPRLGYMWGDTRTTASDLITLYRYLLHAAPAGDADVIFTALSNATRLGADGFYQYFGIPDAAGDRAWAVKQGWACCRPDRALHTTGIVDGRYLIVVLTTHPPQTSWATAERQLTTLVTRLLRHLPPIGAGARK
ncbi:hypothetical protein Athai_36920 [Actinocatenispora thailandica]|uniref:Serine hydrolase n=1 Tax=Actinocatenispora thailandica TaxID=227318 RepID=A0A7R7DQU5_9ACTN|nr:hypothetical protein [Actinocatenispora thailandica]BCJ36189.1 hypothetical protein Athai_36920 [Actinocatenispora thailandica]